MAVTGRNGIVTSMIVSHAHQYIFGPHNRCFTQMKTQNDPLILFSKE